MLVTKVMRQVTTEVQDGVTVTLNKDQAEQLIAVMGGINYPDDCIASELYAMLEEAGVESGKYKLTGSYQVRLLKVNG